MIASLLVSSRDNPVFKYIKRLAQGSLDYRRAGQFWVEGEHLLQAALLRQIRPQIALFAESYWPVASASYRLAALKNIIVPDRLYRHVSALESGANMGFVFDLPAKPALQADAASVVLDRLQDAGNVGAILRSASAFGFKQVIAMKGTAALWSAKVLRAAMGAHWGLQLLESADLATLDGLKSAFLLTSSHQGQFLHRLLQTGQLPMPCVWLLGHEGQGVNMELAARASQYVRIAQPGGEESLNVAAAAAICLHASASGLAD